MSVENILNDWNADPRVKPSQAVQQEPVSQLQDEQVIDQSISQPVPQQAPQGDRSMIELLKEKGVDLNEQQSPVQSTTSISKAQEIENLWNDDLGKSNTQKHLENLDPEQFKAEFMNRMATMDIGERTNIEKFLFGDTAKEANPVQAFLRGARGELTETGLGVKQRFEDITGTGTEETENKNELMRKQIQQQQKTDYPMTTTAGKIAGTVAEFAPLVATGAGAVPLLLEGAAYGATRPQEKGYTATDVALTTGGEALLSLVGGKVTQKLVDTVAPIAKNVYSKITGKQPEGKLISDTGEPSQELIDALESQGVKYEDMLSGSGVFDEMKQLLKAQPANVDPEQAVRSARYESLGIKPTKAGVTQGFDDAVESQVLRRQINEPEAAALRDALSEESEGFKNALTKLADETGDPDIIQAGETIRSAIKGRMKGEREAKNEAYRVLAEESEKMGNQITVDSTPITEAWNQTRKIKRSQMSPLHSDVKESLMRYGVIEPDEAFNKLIAKGDETLEPLTVKNFETLRQELNANINPQDPATSAILRPIIKQLDESVDLAAEGVEAATKMSGLSKEARGKAREFKQEFDSKNMVSDILKTKKGTFDSYQIKGQDIFNKLVKTSRKTPTLQQLDEVVTTLEKSGPKGEKAIADLQSATIINLLNDATSQLSAKGMKGQNFSYTAFRKAFNGIGKDELNRLFKNNPKALSTLTELEKAAKDSQTFFDAVPKGSAADLQNMFTRSFAPLFEAVGFAKAGTIGRMAAQALSEKAGDTLSKSKLRKAVAEEIKAKPQIRKDLKKISEQYPGLFESLGIAITDKAIRDNEE